MGHKLRFEEPDGIYHIGSRGNNGEMMFRDEVDRMEWLRLFAKVAVKYRWVGWTYVLMGNHFHFLVQIPHGGLSRGMQVLNTGYTVRTNKRYGRTGHLVRNRFYSDLVEDEAHFDGGNSVHRPESGPRGPLRIAGGLAVEQLSRLCRNGARASVPLRRPRARPLRDASRGGAG